MFSLFSSVIAVTDASDASPFNFNVLENQENLVEIYIFKNSNSLEFFKINSKPINAAGELLT